MDAEDALADPDAGDGIEIGIVDSAAGLPPEQASECSIAEGVDYCDTDARDPKNHGTMVFGAAEHFASGATYRFYRLFGDGPVYSTDLLSPLSDARDHDIDLLNISAGFPHEGGGNSRLRRAIESTSSDFLVVAAVGNQRRDPTESVNYPARYGDVLSVGGYVSHCTGTVETGETDCRIWVDTESRPEFPKRQGPYCCHAGCSDSQYCGDDRLETAWDGNTRPAAGKPDVLAPPYVPQQDKDGPLLAPGTSFATPMVSGIAAWAAATRSDDLDPAAIKRAIRTTAIPIHDDSKKLNARLVHGRLS